MQSVGFVLWQGGGANIRLKLNQQDVSLGRQKELIMQCLSITDRRSQPSHDQYRRLIWTASRQQSTMNGSSGDLKKREKKVSPWPGAPFSRAWVVCPHQKSASQDAPSELAARWLGFLWKEMTNHDLHLPIVLFLTLSSSLFSSLVLFLSICLSVCLCSSYLSWDKYAA